MLPLSQRHKEEPSNKIIPVAWRMHFSCFTFHKDVRKSEAKLENSKISEGIWQWIFSMPVLRLPVLSVQLFRSPSSSSGTSLTLLGHRLFSSPAGKSFWNFQDPQIQLLSHSPDTNSFHTFTKSSLCSASPSLHRQQKEDNNTRQF